VVSMASDDVALGELVDRPMIAGEERDWVTLALVGAASSGPAPV